MDTYISYANALTVLGSGNILWDSLLKGKSGLVPTQEVYRHCTSSVKSENGYIGAFKEFKNNSERLPDLFSLINKNIIPPEFNLCDMFIGACSLGDINGAYKGVPEYFFREYINEISPRKVNNFLISNACSSGTDAINSANILIKSGAANIIGVLAFDTLEEGKLLQHYILNTQTKDTARPFDLNRSGTSFGEGAAFVIVANDKGLDKIKADPLVKISGFGASCDAFDITVPDKTGRWASLAITRAMNNARLSPIDISYINAHGSGTLLNDRAESIALKEAFGETIHEIPVSSTKGAIGHTLGATGLIETVIATWALINKKCPPNIGLKEQDPEIGMHILTKQKALPENKLNYTMSITFGFGGVNSVIILGEI